MRRGDARKPPGVRPVLCKYPLTRQAAMALALCNMWLSGRREQCAGWVHSWHMEPVVRADIPRTPGSWRALSDLTDDRLVELAQGNDLVAFEALMRRHNRRLFRVARTVLRDVDAAEDAVQEAYLRAFTKLSTYKPTGHFSAWMTRVALNEALMMRRRERADTVSIDEVGEELVSQEDPAANDAQTADSSSRRRTRARCSNTPSTRCRKISAWCSCCGSSKDSMCAKPRNAWSSMLPPCARDCSVRNGSCAANCRDGCRARVRRSSISEPTAAISSSNACCRLPH